MDNPIIQNTIMIFFMDYFIPFNGSVLLIGDTEPYFPLFMLIIRHSFSESDHASAILLKLNRFE